MKQTLKYILEHLVVLRKFAEEKHSVTIALASAVILFFSSFITNQNEVVVFLCAISIVMSLISVLYSFVAISVRRVKSKSKHSPNDGDLMDYKNIAKFDADDYLMYMKKNYKFPKNYVIDEFDRDLAKEIIVLAKAISLKFNLFNFSLFFLAVSILCGVLIICVLGAV